MKVVGQVVFYIAVTVGATAAVASISGLVWMVVVAIRSHGARRPMWLSYTSLIFGLALPIMVLGLVLWGRLDWWFLLFFAPFAVGRLILFRLGSSISRRKQASDD